MWLYPGLLTFVHMVRMKWEEIQGWNVTPHSAVAMCLSLVGDVALVLWWGMFALFAPPVTHPHGCPSCLPHKDRAHRPQWGSTGGQAPLGAAQEPTLASAASREMPQGRTQSPPLLPFISHPCLFVPSLIAELAIGILILFSFNTRALSVAYLGTMCSTMQFVFIKVLFLTWWISHVLPQELQQIQFEGTCFDMIRV